MAMNSESSEEECTVLGPVAAVLRLSRVVGTAPLQFEKQGTCYRVRLARAYSYHGFIIVILGNVLVLWTIATSQTGPSVDTNVYNAGSVAIAASVTAVVATTRNRLRCFIRTINKLQTIHMDLNCLWPRPWTRKHTASLVAWVVFDLVIFIPGVALDVICKKELYEKHLAGLTGSHSLFFMITSLVQHFLNFWLIQLCEMQFVLLLLAVRSGFSAVNHCLATLSGNMSPAAAHVAMRRISLAHAMSCGAVRDVDRSHGAVLMLFLATLFMHLLTTPYFIITRILTNDEELLLPRAVGITYEFSQVVWCVVHLVHIVLIVEPCHLTYAEMESTRWLVSRLLQQTRAGALAGELEQFRKQLALSRASYRPLSCVTMDRALVLKIIGSITTYIVVLINLK